ncbi:MAG: DUF6065 family protein [Vulcanimicrobiaceae bacterium]|jgi:hypothetical protein
MALQEPIRPEKPDAAPRPYIRANKIDSREAYIDPAARARLWMNETTNHFANRCLPLLMANQAGWVIANPCTFIAMWNGGKHQNDTKIVVLGGPASAAPKSHFGSGIITFSLPFLVRTSPGYNLLVRGPANWPVDGICALEGLVETDWSAATFTMNWKLTRAKHPVVFDAGVPFCMLVPQKRGELESFRAEVGDLESQPALQHEYNEWGHARKVFNDEMAARGSSMKGAWQKHYFLGSTTLGRQATEHQTRLELERFEARTSTESEQRLTPDDDHTMEATVVLRDACEEILRSALELREIFLSGPYVVLGEVKQRMDLLVVGNRDEQGDPVTRVIGDFDVRVSWISLPNIDCGSIDLGSIVQISRGMPLLFSESSTSLKEWAAQRVSESVQGLNESDILSLYEQHAQIAADEVPVGLMRRICQCFLSQQGIFAEEHAAYAELAKRSPLTAAEVRAIANLPIGERSRVIEDCITALKSAVQQTGV